MSDLLRVLSPRYETKNEYERILRWLGIVQRHLHRQGLYNENADILREKWELSDTELEMIAMFLSKNIGRTP